MPGLFRIARSMLFKLPAEDAHNATLRSLEHGIHPHVRSDSHPELGTDAFGLTFPNPIGIAAGFDKDARVPDAVLKMGCGFSEIGTVTPLPQHGNPKPRVFRLLEDEAVINRLGFNNGGHAAALKRLKNRANRPGIVSVNIGANKDSKDRIQDYVEGITTFADVASYYVVNISSPNTPGLRDLQAADALDELLKRVQEARRQIHDQTGRRLAIVVKIAPDLDDVGLQQTIESLVARKVDGIAVSNTTLSRPNFLSSQASEAGGLSGAPLFDLSTSTLARVFKATNGDIPLIGIGGIDSGQRAVEKIKAGATLIQLYTGLVYKGPALISEILAELKKSCRDAGVKSLEQLRGCDSDRWAKASNQTDKA